MDYMHRPWVGGCTIRRSSPGEPERSEQPQRGVIRIKLLPWVLHRIGGRVPFCAEQETEPPPLSKADSCVDLPRPRAPSLNLLHYTHRHTQTDRMQKDKFSLHVQPDTEQIWLLPCTLSLPLSLYICLIKDLKIAQARLFVFWEQKVRFSGFLIRENGGDPFLLDLAVIVWLTWPTCAGAGVSGATGLCSPFTLYPGMSAG